MAGNPGISPAEGFQNCQIKDTVMKKKIYSIISVVISLSLFTSCIVQYSLDTADPDSYLHKDKYVEKRPARLLLNNGKEVDYYDGFTVESDTIRTMGFCISDSTAVVNLAMDSVLEIEYRDWKINYIALAVAVPVIVAILALMGAFSGMAAISQTG